jgi:signal transduction histidine kinase
MNAFRWASPFRPMTGVLQAPFTRRAGTEVLYVLATAVVALVGLAYAIPATLVGVALSLTRLGGPATAAVLSGARRFGEAHRSLAHDLLKERIPPPPERGRAAGRGLRSWVKNAQDSTGYRAYLHLLVQVPVAAVGLAFVYVTWICGLLLLTYPLQRALGLNESVVRDSEGNIHHSLVPGLYFDTWPSTLSVSVTGACLLALAPWAVRTAVRLDLGLLRALLGKQTPNAAERIRALEEARSYAVEDAAATLRRIERDLHDGAQVRLVGLTMQLTALKESLPDDTSEETRRIVDGAHTTAREAIAELRELVRGIHPPVLDKGLDVALASLAASSPVPADLETDLPVRPSAAIESIAYFCASELLANVGKHAHARRVTVEATEPGTGRTQLLLRVTDDGRGGARPRPGSGLAGLIDRVRTVDGELRVDSPVGGPTAVTVTLPLTTSVS